MGWRSSEERAALGKAEWTSVPREAHAELVPTDHDAVDLVVGQEADRLQNLLPIRHGRMLASPFAFSRGSAIVVAYDLASRSERRERAPALPSWPLAGPDSRTQQRWAHRSLTRQG